MTTLNPVAVSSPQHNLDKSQRIWDSFASCSPTDVAGEISFTGSVNDYEDYLRRERMIVNGYTDPPLIRSIKLGIEGMEGLDKHFSRLFAETTTSGYTALHCAVSIGHVRWTEIILSKGVLALVDKGTLKDEGETPLHCAASEGHVDCIRLLLEQGASIDIPLRRSGALPLHLAARRGHADCVSLLLEAGANVNSRQCNESAETPLHLAAISGNAICVRYLLDAGAEVEAQLVGFQNYTPLHCAAKWGNAECVRTLLGAGAIVDSESRERETPLHLAALSGDSDCVNQLLEAGARVSARLSLLEGYENLYRGKYADYVKFLLVGGTSANPEKPMRIATSKSRQEVCTKLGEAQIDLAAMSGNPYSIQHLVQAGAKVKERLGKLLRGHKTLHCAARGGYAERVKLLLNARSSANTYSLSSEGETPLHLAALSGNAECIHRLINAEARISDRLRGFKGYTPLHYAALGGHHKCIELLLKKGAKVDSRAECFDGETPLHLAASYGHAECVKLLLSKKTDPDVRLGCLGGSTPLHCAVSAGYVDCVVALLHGGADINARMDHMDGSTPLHIAVMKNKSDVCSKLVGNGPDLLAQAGYPPYTALDLAAAQGKLNCVESLLWPTRHKMKESSSVFGTIFVAARYGKTEILEYLLHNGDEVNTANVIGMTALHYASFYNRSDTVTFLLTKGADVNRRNILGQTSLHLAAYNGNEKICKLLITNSNLHRYALFTYTCSPFVYAIFHDSIECFVHLFTYPDFVQMAQVQDSEGNSLLHKTARYNAVKIMLFLLRRGCDVNSRNIRGKTPLHVAASHGHEAAAHILLKKGAFINQEDESQKRTPLIEAVINDKYSMVKFLIKRSADPCRNDFMGRTILHLAVEHSSKSCVEGLLAMEELDHEAKDSTPEGNTALHIAAGSRNEKITKSLLRKVSANIRNNIGATPLFYSLYNLSMTYLLVKSGANVNAKNVYDETPLHVAMKEGSAEVVRFLLDNEAEVDVFNKENMTPLHLAAKLGKNEHLNLLERKCKKLDIGTLDCNEYRAVHLAAATGNIQVITWFLNRGISRNICNRKGITLVHVAAATGQDEVLRFLVEKKADINVQTYRKKYTPFQLALGIGQGDVLQSLQQYEISCMRGIHFDCLKILSAAVIDHMVYIKHAITTSNGSTLLLEAVRRNSEFGVQLFTDAGVSVNCKAERGYTPLHYSVINGNVAIAKLLLSKGALVNAITDEENKSPLHFGIERGYRDMVKLLVDNGANIEQGTRHFKPVHLAVKYRHLEILKTLVSYGANIMRNADNDTKDHVLHLAVENEDIPTVTWLIEEMNVPVSIENNKKTTPLHIACLKGNVNIARYLIENGAKINARDLFNKRTPLHIAASNGHEDLCLVLLNKGADVNACTWNKNETPLHFAAKSGFKETVKLLLEAKADYNTVNSNWQKPHDCAAENAHFQIVDMLLQFSANKEVERLKKSIRKKTYQARK